MLKQKRKSKSACGPCAQKNVKCEIAKHTFTYWRRVCGGEDAEVVKAELNELSEGELEAEAAALEEAANAAGVGTVVSRGMGKGRAVATRRGRVGRKKGRAISRAVAESDEDGSDRADADHSEDAQESSAGDQ
jgi:hypothetical protein